MAADTLINDFELPFQLYDVLGVEHLTEHAKFAEHSRETFDAVLGTANKIATDLFSTSSCKPHHSFLWQEC